MVLGTSTGLVGSASGADLSLDAGTGSGLDSEGLVEEAVVGPSEEVQRRAQRAMVGRKPHTTEAVDRRNFGRYGQERMLVFELRMDISFSACQGILVHQPSPS